MKNTLFLFFILFIFFCGCKTTKQVVSKSPVSEQASAPAVDFSDQATWLLGYFNPALLTHSPYSVWYLKGFDDYMAKTDAINKLLEIDKEGITVKVIMGTWCPDSRREVPRFMRIIDLWHFPVEKLTFIGVDDAKLSPVGEYSNLDIHRVPTFIIYKNNIEAGRIIENPKTSLEQDMVNILTGMNNNK
jgi:thiol-disulfide isomerase/thioredoxin